MATVSSATVLTSTDEDGFAGLTREEARLLTNQIAKSLALSWELIVRAYHGRAWSALGYESWDAYCKGEFGHARLALPAEEREARVHSLRAHGLSTRAIAAATGVSDWTVRDDLAGARNLAPAPVTGIDGKVYPQERDDEVIEAEIVEEDDDVTETATRQNRVPLVKQFRKPVTDLTRAARRIEALSGDDRMRQNRRLLNEHYLQQLIIAHKALGDLIAELEKGNGAVS